MLGARFPDTCGLSVRPHLSRILSTHKKIPKLVSSLEFGVRQYMAGRACPLRSCTAAPQRASGRAAQGCRPPRTVGICETATHKMSDARTLNLIIFGWAPRVQTPTATRVGQHVFSHASSCDSCIVGVGHQGCDNPLERAGVREHALRRGQLRGRIEGVQRGRVRGTAQAAAFGEGLRVSDVSVTCQ